MVSPRKRNVVVGRLRSGAKGKSDSPEDWVSGGSFNFVESPVISRKDVNKRRVSHAGKIVKEKLVQNRRQSFMLKRLETDMVARTVSPRKTRRQSMAMITSAQLKLVVSSPPPTRSPVKRKPMLPPKKPAPVKAQESNVTKSEIKVVTGTSVKNFSIAISPIKFYSSPQKQKSDSKPSSPRRSGEGAKRKIDVKDISDKMESSPKKSKRDTSVKSQSPSSKERQKRTSVSAKPSPAASGKLSPGPKKTENHSASPSIIQKKVLRSAIPLRAVKARSSSKSPGVARGKTSAKTPELKSLHKKVSPLNKAKASEPLKTNKTPSPQKKPKSPSNSKVLTLSAEKKLGPRITRNSAQQERNPKMQTQSDKKQLSPKKKSTSPKPVTSAKKQAVKSPKGTNAEVKAKTEETVSKSKSSSKERADIPKITVTPPKKIESLQKEKATPATLGKKSSPIPKKDKTPVTKKQSALEPRKKSISPSHKTKTPVSKSKSLTAAQMSTSSSRKSTSPILKNKSRITPKANATPVLAKQKRLTRSAAKSSRKVSIVGKSPSTLVPSFRKTPGSKKTTFKDDDMGSSPMLSAKSQLELIRSRSPLRGVQKIHKMKSKPYTPKPDSPPSNILKKNLKNKVSQQMKAVTQVEVHQLMNGEISRPVKITASSITTTSNASILQRKFESPISTITPRKPISSSVLNGGDPEIRVLPTTPVSASNLPPTPTSSRKLSESVLLMRRVTSESSSKTSCQRILAPAAPRSSTPIEEDNSVIESLKLGTVIKKMDTETNFTDDSINTDLNTDMSDLEASLSEFKENKSPSTEKKSKWSCLLM